MTRTALIFVAAATFLVAVPAVAKPARGVAAFSRVHKPVRATQHYAFGRFKVPQFVAKGLRKVGLGKQLKTRSLLQVTNATLKQFTKATAKGYLEVVVPKGKGHVYFRYGGKVYDFYPGGLRVGEVRRIGSDRYGMLVKLAPKQEKRLRSYLKRVERTKGAELGTYDFHGDKGFHCVSWFMRAALGPKQGDNLVKLLGGRPKDGRSMPRFARFMLKKAHGVEAVAVYKADPLSGTQLGKLRFGLMSSSQLRQAHRAAQ